MTTLPELSSSLFTKLPKPYLLPVLRLVMVRFPYVKEKAWQVN